MRMVFLVTCFFCLMGLFVPSSSASTFLSDSVFGLDAGVGGGGRTLLQARKACTVNFEFMNYTVITSQCKGPSYPVKECCSSLKEFACPYIDVLNDLSTDCASTMFSYINLYGKYPPGLFASQCTETKEGLLCPALSPSQSANDSGSHALRSREALLLLSAGLLVMMLQFF
ncbi:GPI-anchored protein LLG1 [Linum grandiflorum]